MDKIYDVTAMGEMLIDFTKNGESEQGNGLFEACPGGAPCNVLAMLNKLGRKTAFIGKGGNDQFGRLLKDTIDAIGIETKGLILDEEIKTTLAFVHTFPDGDREFSFYRKPGADMMLEEKEVDEEKIFGNKKGIINIDTISRNFEAGDIVTINSLKDKKLIDKNVCFVKVLARGIIDKPLIVKAQDFSLDAAKMIQLTGGKVVLLNKKKY